jgi:hypothetical protein
MSIEFSNWLKQPQKGTKVERRKRGNGTNQAIMHIYMEVPQGNSLNLKQAKMSFHFSFF